MALIAASAIRKRPATKSTCASLPKPSSTTCLPQTRSAQPKRAGFINIRLSDRWLQSQVLTVLQASAHFGDIAIGQDQRWQVEYVSANPTGPIHYGGARNAALGDGLANVLEAAGYTVQREFYVNDAGNQFGYFIESLYARYAELLGQSVPFPENGYPGEYLIVYARLVIDEYGDKFLHMDKAAALAELREIARKLVVVMLRAELDRIGVQFDNWYSEQTLYDNGLVEQALSHLDARGELVRRDGAVWFQASKYPKNAKDEVVVRSNGIPTYFCQRHRLPLRQVPRAQIRPRGQRLGRPIRSCAAHGSHDASLWPDPDRLVILMYDLVKLVRDGVEVKLSKRAGNLLTISDVVDEVGADALRFNLLTRSPESVIEFDLDLAVAQTNENPVYYVQYSHARICSILARASRLRRSTTASMTQRPLCSNIRPNWPAAQDARVGGASAVGVEASPHNLPPRHRSGQDLQRLLPDCRRTSRAELRAHAVTGGAIVLARPCADGRQRGKHGSRRQR